MAGLITMVKSLPTLVRSIQDTARSAREYRLGGQALVRTDQDIPLKWVGLGVLVVVIILAFAPITIVGVIGALSIAVFGFLFVAVASRIVGIVGSSSSPVSGMTIDRKSTRLNSSHVKISY